MNVVLYITIWTIVVFNINWNHQITSDARRQFKKAKSFLSAMYDILEVDEKDPNDFELIEDDYIQFKSNFFNFVVENGNAKEVDEVLNSPHGKKLLIETFGSGTLLQTILNPIVVGPLVHRATKRYLKHGDFYQNLNLEAVENGEIRQGLTKTEQNFHVDLQLELEKYRKKRLDIENS